MNVTYLFFWSKDSELLAELLEARVAEEIVSSQPIPKIQAYRKKCRERYSHPYNKAVFICEVTMKYLIWI